MNDAFSLQKSTEGDVSVVALSGFVDAHTAPEFEQAIQTEFEAGRSRIVVDCTALSYISSAGLGVFMGFIEDVRDNDGDIKICGLVPKVRQVFDLLGFEALFDMVGDLPTALRRFASGAVGEDARG